MNQDNTPFGGPYVAAACFCEKVLQEADNVASLIRIVDRTTVTLSGPAVPSDLPPVTLSQTLFIALKAGSVRGKMNLSVKPFSPDGHALPTIATAVLFEGDDRGVNLIFNTQLEVKEEGLYWFEVAVDDQLLTRVPYRVLYQRMSHQAR